MIQLCQMDCPVRLFLVSISLACSLSPAVNLDLPYLVPINGVSLPLSLSRSFSLSLGSHIEFERAHSGRRACYVKGRVEFGHPLRGPLGSSWSMCPRETLTDCTISLLTVCGLVRPARLAGRAK